MLQCTEETTYLGVQLSRDLSWSTHINGITTKASRTLGFLKRNLRCCPRKLKETAYFTLVRSRLEYCSTIWDPHLKKDICAVEALQRRAARFVKNDFGRYSSVTRMLAELQWASLEARRREARLVLLYKALHNMVAVPTDSLIQNQSRTRQSAANNFRQFAASSAVYQHSFFPRTVVDWNRLPSGASQAESVSAFRSFLPTLD